MCVWGGMTPPHISRIRSGKCHKSERLESLLNWCTSYSGRTRTHPYGVSGCPVRGTSKNYCLFETIPACIRPNH